MKYKDYYEILGVARDAKPEDIKRAYRRMARKYHPDVSKEPDAEERFKEVNEAHEVLSDTKKRAAYDRLGSGWREGQDFRPPPDFDFTYSSDQASPEDLSRFSDFFASIFGHGFSGAGTRGFDDFARASRDQTARIAITLEEAFQGTTRTLQLSTPELDAQGHVRHSSRTLRVRIPKGVGKGQHIRLTGQGQPAHGGGKAGDLYLEIDLLPHPLYRVEGRDVHLELPIAPWEAALGATVAVPTLGGPVNLRIPAGSQTGRKLRLKSRGLPGDPPGDEYVLLAIVVPEANTDKAREAYRRFAEELPFDPRAKLGVQS